MSTKFLHSVKYPSFLVMSALVLLAACSRGAEPTPQATQTPLPPPLDITYCDINPSDVCLEGFGLDIEERVLILFRADDRSYADIYIRADGPDGEIFFECQPSGDFSENIYCLGEPFPEGERFPEGELIKLNIYSKSSRKLMAIGVFYVQYSDLPEPDVLLGADATPTPSIRTPSPQPSYPNPSYPNPSYPNPSYPNPTSAP